MNVCFQEHDWLQRFSKRCARLGFQEYNKDISRSLHHELPYVLTVFNVPLMCLDFMDTNLMNGA